MNKFLLTVSCCFVLTEAHNITIDNINKSIILHKTSIEQKMRCMSDETIKTKYTNELQNGKSLQISRLIALTKHGLPSNSSLDSLQINETKSGTNGLNLQKYSQLINANSIDDLINIIGSKTIKNWNTNEESGKNKLNTFFGFACATNARVNKKTFSQQDRHKVIDEIFIKIWNSSQTHLKTRIKRNLDIAFDSWEVHCLDYLFGDKKTHTVGISNGSGRECFNNTAQQNFMCLPELHSIIKDIAKKNAALDKQEMETRPKRIIEHIRKNQQLENFPNVPKHLVSYYNAAISNEKTKEIFYALVNCVNIDSRSKLDKAVYYCLNSSQLSNTSPEKQEELQEIKQNFPWVEQISNKLHKYFSDEACRKMYLSRVRPILWNLFPETSLTDNEYKDISRYQSLIKAEYCMIEKYMGQKEGSHITANSNTQGSLSRNILENVQSLDGYCTMADSGQDCSKFLLHSILEYTLVYSKEVCPNYTDTFVKLFHFQTENHIIMGSLQSRYERYICLFKTNERSPSSTDRIYNVQAGTQANCDEIYEGWNNTNISDAVPPKYLLIDTAFEMAILTAKERKMYDCYGMKELSNLTSEALAEKRIVNYVLSLSVPTNKRYKYIFRSAGCKSGNMQGGHWTTVKRNLASFEYISDSYVDRNYSIKDASSKLAQQAMYVIYERLDDATILPIK